MIQYKNGDTKHQYKLSRAINKYGWNDITIEILIYANNYEDLNWWEIHYIKRYDCIKNGYNISIGGYGKSGTKMKEKNKQKLRMIRINAIMSEETKYEISQSMIGEKNHFYGKHHTQETKDLIGYKARNRPSIISNINIVNQVIDLYNSGLNFRQCSKILNIGKTTVERIMKFNNIARRDRLRALRDRKLAERNKKC